jgi:iron-sulfur cluster assembly protein
MATVENPTTLVSLTANAAAKVKDLMAGEPEGEAAVLRVAIQGGGCSGFQYGLGFDSGAVEDDLEFESEGVRVVVDPYSAPYLKGASIDFIESIQEAGFKIDNPNAVASCGCGHSFTAEDGTAEDGAAEAGAVEGHEHTHDHASAGGCGCGSGGCC